MVSRSGVEWVGKPWGHEQIWAHVPGKYCAKLLFVTAGMRLSLQYHVVKDETMLLQSGLAYLLLGQTLNSLEHVDMRTGTPYHIPPGTIHRLCAVSDTIVLETSTTELDDVVRVDDDHGRRAVVGLYF